MENFNNLNKKLLKELDNQKNNGQKLLVNDKDILFNKNKTINLADQ